MDIDSTLKERGARYGSSFEIQSCTAQALKDVMHAGPRWENMSTDKKESLHMIATKLSRILHGDPNYHDSWHDIVGYAKLVADTLVANPITREK